MQFPLCPLSKLSPGMDWGLVFPTPLSVVSLGGWGREVRQQESLSQAWGEFRVFRSWGSPEIPPRTGAPQVGQRWGYRSPTPAPVFNTRSSIFGLRRAITRALEQ